jgi:phage terminase small subunit
VPESSPRPFLQVAEPTPAKAQAKPPAHLAAATRRWFEGVITDYDLDPHHLRLLQAAAEAWDELRAARRALKKFGSVYTDRFGQPRARPEVAIVRDSRIAFARLLRELDLDAGPPPDTRLPRRGRR